VIGNGARAESRVLTLINGFGSTTRSRSTPRVVATNSTVMGAGAVAQGTNSVVIGSGASTQGDGFDATGTILLKDQNDTVVGTGSATVRGWVLRLAITRLPTATGPPQSVPAPTPSARAPPRSAGGSTSTRPSAPRHEYTSNGWAFGTNTRAWHRRRSAPTPAPGATTTRPWTGGQDQ
jgi:hypothetical protein